MCALANACGYFAHRHRRHLGFTGGDRAMFRGLQLYSFADGTTITTDAWNVRREQQAVEAIVARIWLVAG